ncbi:hypothetical protein GCM10027169_32720 [Gordonia jinhuaensis]|uniref:Beta-ketoacyl synthase-like N-terminal domain-containing protein n=1 Tax=Gordonia jinhuaensis TaxID=1517702 RepID=A0A916T7F6_9ACTN|nr:beta-ketoacyl synthase N-terminal-like domain-containing protein [Gordonia jinhuaensis]GGB33318.1 hypothetical protein GCM10011489_21860 [Gordonia jinhuaensis]
MSSTPKTYIADASVLASSGSGLKALACALDGNQRAVGAGASSVAAQDGAGPSLPIPGFDIKDYVPGKGTRHLDRTTAISLAAASMLDLTLYAQTASDIGIALGTIAGSVPASIELDIDILTGTGSAGVNPKRFPNCTMNCAASQVAIRNGLKGPNSTTSAGVASAFVAMRYAKRAITNGHAKQMIVGGVEELSDQIRWGIRKKQEVGDVVPISEASAMFVVESSDSAHAHSRSRLGAVLSCETGFFDPIADVPRERLLRTIERALAAAGVSANAVQTWLPGNRGTLLEDAEREAAELAHVDPGRVLDVRAALGETGSALGALQVIGLLACSNGGLGLVTAMDFNGVVAAAIVEVEAQ